MKNTIFAAVLLLLTARGAHGVYEFRSYTLANYGSPFTYMPTTADDLISSLNGGLVNSGGIHAGTLDELLQEGPASWSDAYDPAPGHHVAYSASTVFRPAEPLSTAAPGIGAKVSAAHNFNPGAATVIGESYAYLKETLQVTNLSGLDQIAKRYDSTLKLDGVVHTSGDAIAQVGLAIRIHLDNGASFTKAKMLTFQEQFGGIVNTFNFGQPNNSGKPITLTQTGLYGTELINQQVNTMTIEQLLYVRAQTGGLHRAAGTASADFSNTLRVSNIRFYDENDQVIPGLQIVNSNGDAYPYNAVPEPATLAIFGIGSIGLLFARFRRPQSKI